MAIDIGSAAIDRADAWNYGFTLITLNNPANATGTIDTFEVFFKATAQGVIAGTAYGSGASYTTRDSESLGTVTGGSKQTFSGLSCDVVTGDFAAIFFQTAGTLEWVATGTGGYYKTGNQFGAGTQTYTSIGGDWSLYGTGTESAVGQPYSSRVQGVQGMRSWGGF